MKYIDEFRDGRLARAMAADMARTVIAGRSYRLMEFCGGHTHAISRYGLEDLLPSDVHLIHGPGCPVCVLPIGRVDQAIDLALGQRAILCTYADTLRVPASDGGSLLKAKARGADVRMVYSTQDALQIARQHPDRDIVFLAIGFETTTPPTAVAVRQAAAEGLHNFSILCNHVLNEGRAQVENEFTRAVVPGGNAKARALVDEVFETRESFEWRGLGSVARSALRLRPAFAAFDAELRFDVPYRAVSDHKSCECAAILRGQKRPEECRIFGSVCTPQTPVGSCMVSAEGACAALYSYGRFRTAA